MLLVQVVRYGSPKDHTPLDQSMCVFFCLFVCFCGGGGHAGSPLLRGLFSSCGEQGAVPLVGVSGLLIVVASLTEHGL